MARRRMIDPSIWANEDIALLTDRQFRIYVWAFSSADDQGRLRLPWATIASAIYPAGGVTSQEVRDDIEELGRRGQVILYTDGGRDYLAHPNWAEWQKMNRPTPSKLPAPQDCEQYLSRENGGLTNNSVSTHEQLSESSVSNHEHITNNSVSTHKNGARIERKGSRTRRELEYGAYERATSKNSSGDEPTGEPQSPRETADLATTSDVVSPRSAAVKAVVDGIRESSEDLYGPWESSIVGKETTATYGLIDKAKQRAAKMGQADQWPELLQYIWEHFTSLRMIDDFWAGQPPLPSALNAKGIYPRVINSLMQAGDRSARARASPEDDPEYADSEYARLRREASRAAG